MKILLFFLLSVSAFAGQDEIRFKTGEMALLPYIDMASTALAIDVNASTVDKGDSIKVVVEHTGPWTHEQAMSKFLTTLFLQGYALIKDHVLGTYQILHLRDARDENIPIITEASQVEDSDLLVIYTHKMKYFPVEGMARNLRSFAPASARLIPVELIDTLLLADTSRSMKKYQEIISRMDTKKNADDARDYLRNHSSDETCISKGPINNQTTFIVLFSMVALVLGFLIRGYVIRRIEGGL